jgi:nucleoid-associated protein YgaU
MDVVIFRFSKMDVKVKSNPFGSPDTAKYKTVEEGESLWRYAADEYGDPDKWREIASANSIANPRLIKSGRMVQIPAL